MMMDRRALRRQNTAEEGAQEGIQGRTPHSIDHGFEKGKILDQVAATGISAGLAARGSLTKDMTVGMGLASE